MTTNAGDFNGTVCDDVTLLHGQVGDVKSVGFADCAMVFLEAGELDKISGGARKVIASTVALVEQLRWMLNDAGSLWLWVRDAYSDGSLAMLPERVVIELHRAGWIVRNEVVWECRVGDPAPDNRLKRSYEKVYHLATKMGYYYDRSKGVPAKWSPERKDGMLASKTGVVGTKYVKYIDESPMLSSHQRGVAMLALLDVIEQLNSGSICDYRMAIKGIHKPPQARLKEFEEQGFVISKTMTHSPLVSNLWREARNVTNREIPEELVGAMARLTCRPQHVVVDPYPSLHCIRGVVGAGRKYVGISSDEHRLAACEPTCDDKGTLFDEPLLDVVTQMDVAVSHDVSP